MAKTISPIKRVIVQGKSKGINLHRHYRVLLKNGVVLEVETNEDLLKDKFHLGNGESKNTVWHKDIKSIVKAYLKEPTEEKPRPAKRPVITKYNASEWVITINDKYEYEGVSPVLKNRIQKILNGDSPARAWTILKTFSCVKK